LWQNLSEDLEQFLGARHPYLRLGFHVNTAALTGFELSSGAKRCLGSGFTISSKFLVLGLFMSQNHTNGGLTLNLLTVNWGAENHG
jgi:hypothetical protein